MPDITLAVLDLAGTTVKDQGEVPRAFTAALAGIDVHVTPQQLAGVRGSSKREAVRHFVPDGPGREALTASTYASFRERLTELYRASGVVPIDGAEDLFAWLRARGVRVALNTGFDRDITSLLLTALEWNHHMVDAVVCGDDVAHGRPAPDLILCAMDRVGVTDPQQVVNVGDTGLDLAAGHAAGVRWNVGVLSGAHDRKTLEQAPHTHLLESIAELPDLWEPTSR
jgi:phosphonatase-like hydrolase